jgi:hypothetical protein
MEPPESASNVETWSLVEKETFSGTGFAPESPFSSKFLTGESVPESE